MKPTRRGLLIGAASLAAAGPALAARRTPLVELSRLEVGKPFSTSYPSPDDPVWVLKLGRPAPGGVGPDGDIVAFSALCTHLGCPVSPRGDRLQCPCHFSLFDPAREGMCIQGPASRRLPRVHLEIDGSKVVATGLSDLPWGTVTDG